MKLPNLGAAFVENSKLTAYLLSEENSSGKSAFFIAFGFADHDPDVLRQALLTHARFHEVARLSVSPHGVKYIIEGELFTPDGRSPRVRSVWIIETERTAPRFVTAYPLEG